jgi:hypothetical protein
MQRFVLRILLIVLAVGLVATGLIYYRTQRAAAASRQYISDVFQLQVGTSAAADLARIREKYRGYEFQPEDQQACGNEGCSAAFWFPKGGPYRNINNILHPAFLRSALTLSHGVITAVAIDAVCYHKSGPPFMVEVREHVAGPDSPGPFHEYRHFSPPYVSWIRFELTPAASAEQRSQAYAFNLTYMNQFGTCNDAMDLREPQR